MKWKGVLIRESLENDREVWHLVQVTGRSNAGWSGRDPAASSRSALSKSRTGTWIP